jgi:hypothetical protein
MKVLTRTTIAAAMLWSGTALAQSPAQQPSGSASTPKAISGEVVDIDLGQKMVTLRGQDGKTYKFQASDETLKDLKKGDKLDATLRPGSGR